MQLPELSFPRRGCRAYNSRVHIPLNVSRDGELFAVNTVRESDSAPITLIGNRDAGLQK